MSQAPAAATIAHAICVGGVTSQGGGGHIMVVVDM